MELKNLPKGGIVTHPAKDKRVGETPAKAPLAGPTPKSVLPQREGVKTAPGANHKPR